MSQIESRFRRCPFTAVLANRQEVTLPMCVLTHEIDPCAHLASYEEAIQLRVPDRFARL